MACVDRFYYMALYNFVLHIDLQVGVDRHMNQSLSTPSKLPDDKTKIHL